MLLSRCFPGSLPRKRFADYAASRLPSVVAIFPVIGLLVRDTFWPALDEWSPKDAQYMVAEMQATLLGWLWNLPCMVINRLPA